MNKQPTIIGIDGGASKVSAYVIEVSGNNTFSTGNCNSVKEYRSYPEFQNDFIPVDLAVQLSQINENNISITNTEKEQSKAYYSAFIDVIAEITHKTNSESILIGIGMPGIKTIDKRGIVAMANGPRMPNFAAEIEQRLSNTGVALAQPITKLGSDADYCGIGEEYGEYGAFKNVENAYYLGGGTGAADALKLNGSFISFDDCKSWIAKTWEMSDGNSKSMETYCSTKGIQSIYGELKRITQTELSNSNIYLEQILTRAVSGEKEAVNNWQIVSKKIAELLFERITTIYCGWQNNFSFVNPNRDKLDSNHHFKCTLLDRIVIGQRLGNLLKTIAAKEVVIKPLLNNLSQLIIECDSLDGSAISYYLKNGNFNSEILTISELREAPALGAGIDAWNNYVNK